jgi:hypothetical protein
LSLQDVTFRRERGAFVYSFKVGSAFGKWGAELRKDVLIGRRKESRWIKQINIEEEYIDSNSSPISHDWNGRVRRGDYRVKVSVWRSAESIKAWATKDSDPSYPIN